MIDEKLIIEKIESLKNNIQNLDANYAAINVKKYFPSDKVCYLLDKLIDYVNGIKAGCKEEGANNENQNR